MWYLIFAERFERLGERHTGRMRERDTGGRLRENVIKLNVIDGHKMIKFHYIR